MHDVVAHTLSVVSVQSGLARRLVPTRPDDAVEAMQRV
jgi:signal transduction histidine kinase